MVSSVMYACLLLFSLSVAFYAGESKERKVACVFLLGNSATIIALLVSSREEFSYVSAAYLGVDIAAVVALVAIALRHPSWMTILVAAFQVNGCLAHLVKLLAPDTIEISYAILLRAWGWPMVLTLLAARWHAPLRLTLRQSNLSPLPKFLRPAGAANRRNDDASSRRGIALVHSAHGSRDGGRSSYLDPNVRPSLGATNVQNTASDRR